AHRRAGFVRRRHGGQRLRPQGAGTQDHRGQTRRQRRVGRQGQEQGVCAMTPRVRQILKWVGYVAFYLVSLLVFAYLTFPYNRLGDRIVQEFNGKQTGPKPMRLKLGDVSSYWLGGVEAEDITLTSPGDPDEQG